jgi:hypothetical protein
MLIIEKVRLFTPTVNSNHRFDTALDFSICRGAISSRGRFNNPKWSTCFTKAATVFFLLRAKPVKNNRIFTRFFFKKKQLNLCWRRACNFLVLSRGRFHNTKEWEWRKDQCRKVARWFIFKPKIQIWVNFRGSCNGRCWYILWSFGIFYGNTVYFMAI